MVLNRHRERLTGAPPDHDPPPPPPQSQNTGASRACRPCAPGVCRGADPVTQGSRSADPAVARARLDAVAHSERLAALGATQVQADAQAAARAGTSVHSVRRWRAAVAGLPLEDRRGALSGQQGGARRQALSPCMQDCVEALLYEHGPHLTAPHVVRVLATRYGSAPSLRSVQRCLTTLKVTAESARAFRCERPGRTSLAARPCPWQPRGGSGRPQYGLGARQYACGCDVQ